MFKRIITAIFIMALGSGVASAEKTLVVAHDSTWPPMEYVDSNKMIVGYSVDYIDAVSKAIGVKIEHKTVAWDGIFAGLNGGKYDIISSSVTITEERKKGVDFTAPYCEVQQAVIVPVDSNIKTMDDLNNKTIGAQLGTTGFFAIKSIPNATAKSFNALGFAMESLSSGRLDAVICDDPVAKNFALKSKAYAGKFKVAFIVKDSKPEYYGFVVAKGNTELLEQLNKGIKAVQEQGIEKELKKKWFGE